MKYAYLTRGPHADYLMHTALLFCSGLRQNIIEEDHDQNVFDSAVRTQII